MNDDHYTVAAPDARYELPLSESGRDLDFAKPGPVGRDPLTEAWPARTDLTDHVLNCVFWAVVCIGTFVISANLGNTPVVIGAIGAVWAVVVVCCARAIVKRRHR